MSKKEDKTFHVYLRLMQYVKKYWRYFSISLLGFCVFALSQPGGAKLLEYFVEELDGTGTKGLLWVPIALLILVLVRGIGSFLGNFYMARVSTSVIHDLRCQMFNHMIELPKTYFDNNNSGHLLSKITYNVTMVTSAATDALKILIREGLTIFFTVGYLLYTNWRLTLIFVAIIPAISMVISAASKKFRKLSHRAQYSMGDLTQTASESINNYQTVRSFGGEALEQERFLSASTNNSLQNLKIVKTSAVHTPAIQFLVSCAIAVLLYIILWMKGSASTASMVGFVTAAMFLPKPIRQINEISSNIQQGVAAAISIFEVLDQPYEEDTGTITKEHIEGHIEFKNITFYYPNSKKAALKNISFSIKPGQTVALVGKSGSGKTTLASLLPRFYDPQTGEILVDNIPITQYKLKNLRHFIAIVNQNIALFNNTIADNIAYGSLRGASEEDIIKAAKSAHCLEFINELPNGLQEITGENGELLSGGQRQRLAIARALLKNTPILIMDEATSSLDSESEYHIQEALKDVMKNRSTLVIAHRLSTIINAHKIIVMSNGEISESGTHDELLKKNGVYAHLYKIQFKD